MSAAGKYLRRTEDGYLFWCLGCRSYHHVNTDQPQRPRWQFDGNIEAPTFTPSVVVQSGRSRCHLFVRGGQIQYLGDCTHALANQTVPMVEPPH